MLKKNLSFADKFPLLISNLVFGEPYTTIFLNFHLPSLLQELTNCKYDFDVKYLLLTNNESIEKIKESRHFKILTHLMFCNILILDDDADYNARYDLQGLQLKHTVAHALKENRIVHQTSADIYYGKGYFNFIIAKFLLDDSDAIFIENFRCAYESLAPHLFNKETPDTSQLFQLAVSHLHPISISAHWDTPFFSQYPYIMLWGNGSQIISRGFSQSTPFFKPQDWMLNALGSNDLNISMNVHNISFIGSWHDAPSIEMGVLSHYYPPFLPRVSSPLEVAKWAKKIAMLPPASLENLKRLTVYDKNGAEVNSTLQERSQIIVDEIVKCYAQL